MNDMFSILNADNDAALTINILRHWDRDRIERFATHLLGDKAQALAILESLINEKGFDQAMRLVRRADLRANNIFVAIVEAYTEAKRTTT